MNQEPTSTSKSSKSKSLRGLWERANQAVIYWSRPRKISRRLQPYFLETLADLLAEGFHLHQALDFMTLLLPAQAHLIQDMILALGQGQGIERCFQDLGYSIQVVAQLFYAQRQGRFVPALAGSAQTLAKENKHRQDLFKQLAYPLILSLFLLALLFGMRAFMLPQVASFISQETYDQSLMIRLLLAFFTYLPHLTLGVLIFLVFTFIGIDLYYRRLGYLERYHFLQRIPGVRSWIQKYLSYHLAQELAYFYSGGFAIQEILALWLDYPIDPFLTELADYLETGFRQGEALKDLLEATQLFCPELPLVIYQGELTSQVAAKCYHYAHKTYNDLMADIAKKIQWVQPLLFVLIAGFVMAMYLLMMLPMLTMELN